MPSRQVIVDEIDGRIVGDVLCTEFQSPPQVDFSNLPTQLSRHDGHIFDTPIAGI